MEAVLRDQAAAALVNNHTGAHASYPAGFVSHSRSPSDDQVGSQLSPVTPGHPLPHGYNHVQSTQDDSRIHPQLRSAGETAPPNSAYPPVPVPNMMPAVPVLTSSDPALMSGPIPSLGVPPPVGMESGDTADGRKAKRELSQSKRAAQNRAAQRAFRQRKEGYIKKLEQQVKDYTEMEASFKNTQAENYALREYIIHLQSRLLDSLGEYPQPPPNINLALPHPSATGPDSSQSADSTNPLEVAAQAVAGLSRSEHLTRDHYSVKYDQGSRSDDDARTAEEITRQLADSVNDTHPDPSL